MEVELPFPPSVNHLWRRVGYRTLISREGRRFRRRVVAILEAMRVRPLAGKLAIQVEVHPPDRRRRDLDNVLKALLDALEHGGAYTDDAQIVEIHIWKCAAAAPYGKVRVMLRQVGSEQNENTRLDCDKQTRPNPR
jgi:crossover junction endodeoxyribonuclease RusA